MFWLSHCSIYKVYHIYFYYIMKLLLDVYVSYIIIYKSDYKYIHTLTHTYLLSFLFICAPVLGCSVVLLLVNEGQDNVHTRDTCMMVMERD